MKTRNRIIHTRWDFPLEEPDREDIVSESAFMEGNVYDRARKSWALEQLTFDELEKAVKEAEYLEVPLLTLEFLRPKFLKDVGRTLWELPEDA